MAENSKIEWTDATFNPWIGCTKVAPGCTHCYAESFAKRTGKAVWGPNGTRVKTSPKYWRDPLKWNKEAEKAGERRKVFCASMADVFEDWLEVIHTHDGDELRKCKCGWFGTLPIILKSMAKRKNIYGCPHCDTDADTELVTFKDLRDLLFSLIGETKSLDWLLLTKRPENIRRMWPWGWGTAETLDAHPDMVPRAFTGNLIPKSKARRSNVWLGTTVTEQASFNRNMPWLAKNRDLSPVLFLSVEPLLGPIDFWPYMDSPVHGPGMVGDRSIDWVIVGGESGHGARPMHPDWVRAIRDQCQANHVPCFFKQWGEWGPIGKGPAKIILTDGEIYDELPIEDLVDELIRRRGVYDTRYWSEHHPTTTYRVGKKEAGRTLDGREWSEFPAVESFT